MHIYHYSHYLDIPSILKHGLTYRYRDENWSDTLSINYRLQQHRPKHLPDFINRDKCVFFYPDDKNKCGIGNCFYRVNPALLNPELLYVASLDVAQEVYEYNSLEYYSVRYWETLIPYNTYLKTSTSEDMEVLYFGEIPFQLLEVGCSVFPHYRKLISDLMKQYKVETWSSQNRRVFVNEFEVYNIYFSSKNTIEVNTKKGSYDSKLFPFIEQYFGYESKQLYYDRGLHITYHNTKERAH